MHNCRTLQESLVDLIFHETDERQATGLLAELERCPDCLYQYMTMKETLHIFDRVSEAVAPGESYWQTYHQSLRRALEADERTLLARESVASQSVPLWKRILTASIPVPVAAVFALLVLGSALLLLRPAAS